MARELRGPISTIEGFLDLLAGGGGGEVTTEQRELIDVVSRNVSRLSVMVDDWLDMARLEGGLLHLERETVDLEEIVDRAIAALKPRVRAKEQQVLVEVPDEPALAPGDRRALLRVVSNLLSNAHKYTPIGGSIRLALTLEGEDAVRLDVIDSGIGIGDEDQARLFTKFFRAHLTDAEPGSGLGLALVKGLTERMGGTVSARSTLGRGSTFSIVLPRDTRAVDAPEPLGATPVGAVRAAE
jgi:signal transduction histidine kinase